MPKLITDQAELQDASAEDMLFTLKELTGAAPARFSSLAAGRVRVSNAILAAKDRVGHAGVAKGSEPEARALTSEEQSSSSTISESSSAANGVPSPDDFQLTPTSQDDQPAKEPITMRTPTRAKKIPAGARSPRAQARADKKAGKAAAKKVAAKKTKPAAASKAKSTGVGASAGAGRSATYTKVRLTQPDVPRRPQEGSQRSKVLDALKKRKVALVETLSEDVGFDARSFVHKLAAAGWCEVVPGKGD